MNPQIFDDVLSQIFEPNLKKFAIACLKKADPVLEVVPASTSGKYHPPECCQKGGLVVHIKRACYFANVMMNLQDWKENNVKGDILLVSLLLHDIGKKEKYDKYWEYYNHPIVAGEMIKEFKSMLPDVVFNIVYNCVNAHMGPWSPKSIRKPLEKYTVLEYATYQCDYLASRKDLGIIK